MKIGDKVRLLKDSDTIGTGITFSKDEILTIKAYEGEYWYALENSNGDIIKTGSSYFELIEDTNFPHMAIKSYIDGVLERLKGENDMRPDTNDKEEILRLYDLGLNIPTIKDKTGKSRGCIEYVINKYRRGDQTMKRINKNYYKDGLRVTYEDDYIRIFKQFGIFILFDLFIGKNNLTFEQANEMLKPFGIIIEPKSTDWTRVEVGTKLKFTDGRVYGKITFKEWIEQTQQIIVFNGNKVEVYYEDEVELC